MTVYITYLMCIMCVLATCVHLGGTSLYCYDCYSKDNGDCDNMNGTIPIRRCEDSLFFKAVMPTGSKFVCVLQKMLTKDGTGVHIARGCAPEAYCSSKVDGVECLSCDNDLCNSSFALLPSIALSIASVLCSKFYF